MKKKEEEYYDYYVQFLSDKDFENLNVEQTKNLLKLRNLNRRRKQHQKWLDKNKKIYDEYLRRRNLLREIKRDERDVFSDVISLRKLIIPVVSVYTRDETSKSYKGDITNYQRKTYKGKPLQKREVYYIQVRIKSVTKYQKNIYVGNKQKVINFLNEYLNKDCSNFTPSNTKVELRDILMKYFIYHLKDGWKEFSNIEHSFNDRIKPWLLKQRK